MHGAIKRGLFIREWPDQREEHVPAQNTIICARKEYASVQNLQQTSFSVAEWLKNIDDISLNHDNNLR